MAGRIAVMLAAMSLTLIGGGLLFGLLGFSQGDAWQQASFFGGVVVGLLLRWAGR